MCDKLTIEFNKCDRDRTRHLVYAEKREFVVGENKPKQLKRYHLSSRKAEQTK